MHKILLSCEISTAIKERDEINIVEQLIEV